MIDFSFISLHRSLEDVQRALSDRPTASNSNQNNVVLGDRTTCQISNVAGGISFDEYYTVTIADLCGNDVYDISDKVAITSFVHDFNGTQQIAFEIFPLGINRGGEHFILKFTGQVETFYSTPVTLGGYGIIDHFVYFNTKTFEGISYFNSQIKQAISIRGIDRSGKESASIVSSYDQVFSGSGKRVTPKVIRLWLRNYALQYISEFIYDRFQVLLNHEFVYLNGERITNKPQLEAIEWVGESNWGETSFQAGYDPSDLFQYVLQIFDPFAPVTLSPLGVYLISTLPDAITLSFNQDVALLSGTVTVFDAQGQTVATYTEADGIVDGNTVTFPIPTVIAGTYTITTTEMFNGLTGIWGGSWEFTVSDGDYDTDNDYDETQYL